MSKPNQANPPSKKRFLFRFVLGSSLIGLLLCAGAAYYSYRYLKPFYERAQEYDLARIDDLELPSLILDRNGVQIGRMFVENRSVVSFNEVPDVVVNCLISQEDQRFWAHKGVDWIGLVRMAYLNYKAGKVTQGASTLTMQLARNAFNLKAEALQRGENGRERKLVEIFLAHRIGSQYSSLSGKKYIIENYLNRVPFGHGYYGIRSASLGYYGKEPKDLNIAEAASIIACIKNPSVYSPLRHPARNQFARDHVFRRMKEEGYLSEKQYENLLLQPVTPNPKPLKRGTSHLYERIGNLARELLGEEAMSQGGFKIYTTIDRRAQQAAEESLEAQLSSLEATAGYRHPAYQNYSRTQGAPQYLQGSFLAIDPQTGEVLSHVGGRNYNHTQFDFVENAKRPLGTALFPFLYAYAFEQGYHPATLLRDEAIDNRMVMIGGREGILGEWGMETMKPRYEGMITARRALETSKIAATVRLGKELEVERFVQYAERFGFDFPASEKQLTRDLLGWVPVSPLQAVKAYSALANGGKVPERLLYIKKIESADGLLVHLTSELEVRENVKPLLEEATAYQVSRILEGVLTEGNLSEVSEDLRASGFQGAAKTGTPYDFSDGWAIGYNANLVSAAWVGFQQGRKGAILENGFAKQTAWPIVSEFLARQPAERKSGQFEEPADIEAREICRHSGLLATRYCFEENAQQKGQYQSTTRMEYFKKGQVPGAICGMHMGSVGHEKGFVDQYAPSLESTAARPLLAVDPVKPRLPVIVGVDPYGAVQNSASEQEQSTLSGAYASNQLILNDQVLGEEEARIVLPMPKALRLKIKAEDLQPLLPKAIEVE